MQDSAANCGPASVSNALQALGIIRTQAECETLCKTNATDGTTGKNIAKGLKALGCHGHPIREKRADVALAFLMSALGKGRPVILCVDDWEHWVAAVGLLGQRVLVCDPADNELVTSYEPEALMKRWAAPAYYGVIA